MRDPKVTEKARLAKKLADQGVRRTEIASHLGVSLSTVSTYICYRHLDWEECMRRQYRWDDEAISKAKARRQKIEATKDKDPFVWRIEEKLRNIRNACLEKGVEPCRTHPLVIAEAYTGHCAICSRSEKATGKALCIDHCHTTGDFRGWLCNSCNVGVGLLGDSFVSVELAVEYLRSFEQRKDHSSCETTAA